MPEDEARTDERWGKLTLILLSMSMAHLGDIAVRAFIGEGAAALTKKLYRTESDRLGAPLGTRRGWREKKEKE